ncbi:SDR family oxidoreductase, partial [Streptomyces sp. NPDC049577]|uniref:SDR family oxidoreductase n=1 Tax=Streptomyces sp. NPDC049577 TaxID=3155153 RepID=UPI00342616CB
ANVLGTREVLRLATRTEPVPVHYVSTAAVSVGTDETLDPVPEDHRVEPGSLVPGGYAASKWVAEQLVWEAARRGLPVTVHRCGRVSGHTRSGAGSGRDVLWQLVRAMLATGAAPGTAGTDGSEALVDLVPVDYAAAAVVHLSRNPRAHGRAHHLTCPQPLPLSEVLDHLRDHGYRLETLPHEEWIRTLRRQADAATGAERELLDTALLLSDILPTLARLGRIRFDRANTRAGLADSALSFPQLDGELIRTYADHFAATGFFPPTAAH